MDPIPLALFMIGIMTIGKLAQGRGTDAFSVKNYLGAIFVGIMMSAIQKGNKTLATRLGYLIIVTMALFWAPSILYATGLVNDPKLRAQLKKLSGKGVMADIPEQGAMVRPKKPKGQSNRKGRS